MYRVFLVGGGSLFIRVNRPVDREKRSQSPDKDKAGKDQPAPRFLVPLPLSGSVKKTKKHRKQV